MVLAPPGTIDPTPHLYDSTMYALSGLMAVSVIAHGMVRPLPPLSAEAIAAAAAAASSASGSKDTIIDVVGTPVVSEKTETVAGDRQVNK
jgi:hypothetical protein